MILPNTYLNSFLLKKLNNTYNIKIKDFFVHSQNIENEILRFLDNINLEKNYSVLLIGASNGKIIEIWKKKFKNQLYIFEPIKNLEYLQKYLYSYESYISNIHDIFYIKNLKIIIFPFYKRIFPELIDNSFNKEDLIKKIFSIFYSDINKKTFYKFLYLWINNYIKKLKEEKIKFITDFSIEKEKILFCGSGPTLLNDISSLKNLKEYFLISSDSSVIPLLKNNINIDCIISIDPNIATLYHFYTFRNKLKNIPLITWMGARNELFLFFDNIYHFLTLFPLDKIIKKIHPEIIQLRNAGNDVLKTVVEISSMYNMPIEFAGCGIQHNLKQYYINNTGYSYYSNLKNSRVFTQEHYHYYLYKNQYYKIESIKKIINNTLSKSKTSYTTSKNKFKIKELETNSIKDLLKSQKNFITGEFPFLKILYNLI